MKRIYTSLLIVAILTAFTGGCKKANKDTSTTGDQLLSSQITQIEAAGVDSVSKFKDALFADGTNIKAWMASNDSVYYHQYNSNKTQGVNSTGLDAKADFIGRMTEAGFYYANRPIQIGLHSAQPNGLAYVDGSKDVSGARASCCGTSSCSVACSLVCTTPLYGLDGSGLINAMALIAGLTLTSANAITTTDLVDTAIWGRAFRANPAFQSISMMDMGSLPVNQIQAGDLIVEPGVHCGMWMNNGQSQSLFNSLGLASYTCAVNSDAQHGPLVSGNAQNWLMTVFGSSYHVMRVSATADLGCGTEVTDIDGNVYPVVRIGTHCWMAKNLSTAHYRDGSAITEVEDSASWANIYNNQTHIAAWCYNEGDASNNAVYGKLYNWYVVNDSRGVCPVGWHVPDTTEFQELYTVLGGRTVAAGPMKTVDLWAAPNAGGTNASGFSAVPSAYRVNYGSCLQTSAGYEAVYWTTTPGGGSYIFNEYLEFGSTIASQTSSGAYKESGYSIRCIEDH